MTIQLLTQIRDENSPDVFLVSRLICDMFREHECTAASHKRSAHRPEIDGHKRVLSLTDTDIIIRCWDSQTQTPTQQTSMKHNRLTTEINTQMLKTTFKWSNVKLHLLFCINNDKWSIHDVTVWHDHTDETISAHAKRNKHTPSTRLFIQSG